MSRRNNPGGRQQRPKSYNRNHFRAADVTRLVVHCSTGKKGFAKAVAEAKLEQYARHQHGRTKVPTRIYPCDHCDTWHLTSEDSNR